MAAAKTTSNHDEIRRWAEDRGGRPSCVRRTGNDSDPGILRINFPGFSGETSLNEIGWDEWFRKFDDQKLALLYQDQTRTGEKSNFNKIVSREPSSRKAGAGRKTTAGSRSQSSSDGRTKSGSSRSSSTAKSGGRSSGNKKDSSGRATGPRKATAARTSSAGGSSTRRSGSKSSK